MWWKTKIHQHGQNIDKRFVIRRCFVWVLKVLQNDVRDDKFCFGMFKQLFWASVFESIFDHSALLIVIVLRNFKQNLGTMVQKQPEEILLACVVSR